MNGVTQAPALQVIETAEEAVKAFEAAMPSFIMEARSVLAGELHYQAMLYHALRMTGGVPLAQLGMNVKQYVADPVSRVFDERRRRRQATYDLGYESIPDAVIFGPGIKADWRLRRRDFTLREMLLAVELKVSERAGSRLGPKEVCSDIEKMDAHREEVVARGGSLEPVVVVLDTAPELGERMRPEALDACFRRAEALNVRFMHVGSKNTRSVGLNGYVRQSIRWRARMRRGEV